MKNRVFPFIKPVKHDTLTHVRGALSRQESHYKGKTMHARSSGILLHITALPGSPGIGTIGRPALDFVDALADAGQTLWQILPLGPTGYGDSP